LHNIKDGAVSRKLTDLIRKYIPNGASDEVRNSFSAKSMRKGAINYMAAHASTDYYESHVRYGHSFGTSQENYIDRNSLVLSVTAGKALNNYSESSHFLTPHSPPNFEIFGPTQEENVEKLIDELYCISELLPQFKRGGHLRPFLRSATAVLIMSLEDMIKDMGHGNKVVMKVLSAAQKVGLVDPIRAPDALTLGHVLLEWGKLICSDFDHRNSHGFVPSDDDLADTLCAYFTRNINKLTQKCQHEYEAIIMANAGIIDDGCKSA
jgi:hypothetical protein